MSLRRIALILTSSSLTLVPPLRAADFKRDIAPIFKAKCYECHSEKAGKEKNGYVFDNLERLKGSIGPYEQIIPGNPSESPLMDLLTAPDGDKRRMPPKGEGLSPKELKLMREWIKDGAVLEKATTTKPGSLQPVKPKPDPKPAPDSPPSKPATPGAPPAPAPATPAGPMEKWTSADGKVIDAAFVALEGETVVLKMADRAQPYRVPLSKLDADSQKKAKTRASAPAKPAGTGAGK